MHVFSPGEKNQAPKKINSPRRSTYVIEGPSQLSREAVTETSEKTTTACENYISNEDLAQFRITCAEGFADEGRDAFGEVRIGRLENPISDDGITRGTKGKFTISCGEWTKNCSPTEYRSGPNCALNPVGNSYCFCPLCIAALKKSGFQVKLPIGMM